MRVTYVLFPNCMACHTEFYGWIQTERLINIRITFIVLWIKKCVQMWPCSCSKTFSQRLNANTLINSSIAGIIDLFEILITKCYQEYLHRACTNREMVIRNSKHATVSLVWFYPVLISTALVYTSEDTKITGIQNRHSLICSEIHNTLSSKDINSNILWGIVFCFKV